jgi:deoxyribodipyrimidine photolyase-related protein
MRNLILILGDQLTLANPALRGFDAAADAVLMIEAPGEATRAWSHKARITLFLSAMRHFCGLLRDNAFPVHYVALDDAAEPSLAARLATQLAALKPAHLIVCEPGEYRMLVYIQDACRTAAAPLEVRADSHFICGRDEFAAWAGDSTQLRMEFFYRIMRKKTGYLMRDGQSGVEPEGGEWNFDHDNRKGFGRAGPGLIPPPPAFAPDTITREVMALVESRFAGHPGSLAAFNWPVTRESALQVLADFTEHRLAMFGPHQDAMWTDTPFAWHSKLSAALNLKLLDPREVIVAAIQAWRARKLPLASVEGFVRQILGWREFIRGVYWLDMPAMAGANFLGHTRKLPRWYWTGDTAMNCMRDSIGQTLRHGYAHHIQRLMVTGNFALLAEVEPRQVCDWYLGVYVDAVEWAELPNTAGMALFANGGRFTSKPYVASGAYIKRMSNYCGGCRYNPALRHGEGACPVTVLYWNFLDKREKMLAASQRTALMAKNLARLPETERAAIRNDARRVLETVDTL